MIDRKNIVLFISILSIFTSCSSYETVTDVDGNSYEIVSIGKQEWMAENLRTTKFNDGKEILNLESNTDWARSEKPSFSWYENDQETAFDEKIGALYNWYVVKSDKICPTGWHVPNNEDWNRLIFYLAKNGYNYDNSFYSDNDISKARSKLAISLASSENWTSSNTEGVAGYKSESLFRNKSKFSALPGGSRNWNGNFANKNNKGVWWSSSEKNESHACYQFLFYHYRYIQHDCDIDKSTGASIRCIKD